MTVLIPSYEPDERLLALIRQLQADQDDPIVVVDDGSGTAYRGIFAEAEAAGCTVLTHPTNQGKGRALKTGFRYIQQAGLADGVVCADSDGQHLPKDIRRIADSISHNREHIVLGSRRFTGRVPLRSQFGNRLTRWIYARATGHALADTQTGLRGYSPEMLDWLCQVPGERFEYEMNMLLYADRAGYGLHEIPIDTVYLDGNRSSHFRPLADSARIYGPILRFLGSSLLAGALDFVLLLVLQLLVPSLFLSVVLARAGSSLVNYAVNRRYVFGSRSRTASVGRSMPRYYALAAVLLLANYGLLYGLHERLALPLIAAKLIAEAVLFAASYRIQRRFVYRR